MIDLTFSFKEVMYHSILVYNEHGYYNENDALINNTKPTSKRVIDSLLTNTIDVNSPEYELIDYILEWLKDSNKSGAGSYMSQSRKVIENGIQSLGEIGLIASLIKPYNRYCKMNK